ncbi:MAG: serine--tRNA ligase [Nanoarchaeota archaeon]|nr:serine--tRNA ligase [Nanoarchaeota archaeon]
MLDVKLLRESPKIVKESLRKRGMEEKSVDVFLELDERWRSMKQESDGLRSERNKISMQINEARKQGEKADEFIKRAKEIPQKIVQSEEELKVIEEKKNNILESFPNIVDPSVPVGDESKNKILETIGKAQKFKFKSKGHEELLVSLDQLDMERAAKVAGARFYYLKRDIVKMNFAIMQFALDFLSKKGFILMQPPYMIKKESLNSALPLLAFEEMIYKIEGEDLYLIGTAEHALNAYYMNETIPLEKLPVRFAGVSPCFRKEAGSHGKDTKGIFRIHQFEKIEQFVFCKPEDSWKEFDNILDNSREMLKQLGIPFRFVLLSSQDMGRVPTKTIDFEGWFPSQGKYGELGSCSNCLDYQARRANIKFDEKGERKFVNTLNNTAIATERMIACIVDNYQKEDGSIEIPKVLQKYMHIKMIKLAKQIKGKAKKEAKK